jgi:hypothetical protein
VARGKCPRHEPDASADPCWRAAVPVAVAGRELEVALEATTGWRFVVDELEHVGAGVHLAEPAETAARRGKKSARRPIGLTPASARVAVDRPATGLWIPSDHILDLRATVSYRHTLSHQRTEWQQRIQSVPYYHGCRQRRKLMTAEGCEWLARAGARHRPPSDSRAAVMRRSCLRSSAVSDQSHPAPAADRIGAIRLRSSAKPARWTRRPGSQRAAV